MKIKLQNTRGIDIAWLQVDGPLEAQVMSSSVVRYHDTLFAYYRIENGRATFREANVVDLSRTGKEPMHG